MPTGRRSPRRRPLRGAACGLLSATSLLCLLWGFFPPPSDSLQLTLNPKRAATPQSGTHTPLSSGEKATSSPVEPLSISLEYPQQVRLGDRAPVRLWVRAGVIPTAVPESGATHASDLDGAEALSGIRPAPALVEVEIELPGATISPAGPIRQPVTGWEPTEFVWAIGPRDAGVMRGTAWLYLVDGTLNDTGKARQPLAAMPLKILGTQLLGMGGSSARQVGFVTAVLGLILGMPFLEAWMRSHWDGS